MKLTRPWARARQALQRRMAKWCGRRSFTLPEGRALVSFSFDDFPRSALSNGGNILERFGLAGTYYASFGLMAQTTPTGEAFLPDDVKPLLNRGHELGCHTFDHCPAWETEPSIFEASINKNREALHRLAPGTECHTLSYPISYPRPDTKRRAATHFACCRGGGQTFNAGRMDLNYLSAFFLEQSRDQPGEVKALIEHNRRAGGWLIFATHDVCERPTRYGCTPGFFEDIVRHAVESGAEILPVFRAWEVIRARAGKQP